MRFISFPGKQFFPRIATRMEPLITTNPPQLVACDDEECSLLEAGGSHGFSDEDVD